MCRFLGFSKGCLEHTFLLLPVLTSKRRRLIAVSDTTINVIDSFIVLESHIRRSSLVSLELRSAAAVASLLHSDCNSFVVEYARTDYTSRLQLGGPGNVAEVAFPATHTTDSS